MSYGVGCRHGSDSTLLWLWCRPAAAAPIRPLAWELPYAVGVPPPKKKTISYFKVKEETYFLKIYKSCQVSRELWQVVRISKKK